MATCAITSCATKSGSHCYLFGFKAGKKTSLQIISCCRSFISDTVRRRLAVRREMCEARKDFSATQLADCQAQALQTATGLLANLHATKTRLDARRDARICRVDPTCHKK